eukprot:12025090-Ditylum_brightwellii.AAC.1
MVHPRNCAGIDGTMLIHGVDNSVDGGDKHLTHITKAVGCCLKERSKKNVRVDNDNENGVDNSVDFGDKHLTHLIQAVVCCLKARSKQNACIDNDNEN